MGDIGVTLAINCIKAGVFLYDVVTYPIYALIQRPWQKRKAMVKRRVSKLSTSSVNFLSLCLQKLIYLVILFRTYEIYANISINCYICLNEYILIFISFVKYVFPILS